MELPVVLMIAEKPSIAQSISNALSDGKARKKDKRLPVYEHTGVFKGKSALFRITSVAGHVYSLDFPAQYNSWDTVDPVDLFDAPVEKDETSKGTVIHLREEAKGATYLVLWLDCDREGENICFECMDIVLPLMARPKNGAQQVFRARFSAVAAPDIRRALSNLGEPNADEAASVDARQELDLKLGAAMTRFQSRYFQGRYGNLDSALLSFGPCQTPTLGFVVERHDEIQTFAPEPFWSVDVEVEKEGRSVTLSWDRGRVFDQEIGRLFETLVSEGKTATVVSVKESENKRPRPTALNTVEMLKSASKLLGMGPADAMRHAEHLYLQGIISYPRTESTAYPDSFELVEAVQEQAGNPIWGSYARGLLEVGLVRPKAGVDVGDHPPITPMASVSPDSLGGGAGALYDMIVRHFLATVSPDATYLATKIKVEMGGEGFTLNGKRMLTPGFTAILTSFGKDDVIVPRFTEGERLVPRRVNLTQGMTSPPGYLTESDLIEKMEKHGIGTDASIPTHINNIMTRNYCELGPGRTLKPTQLGIVLVHGYLRIDPELVLPKVRSAIEAECSLIAAGKASKAAVLAHALSIFKAKFAYFSAHIEAMNALFASVYDPLSATGRLLSRCGKCRRYMRYLHLKPQRLFCPQCNDTYALPQNGTVKLYKELKCPLDGFELLLFSLGNSANAVGVTYPLCPYCFNNPPFEDAGNALAGGKMPCSRCTHPTCPHSLTVNGVLPCVGKAVDAIKSAAATGIPAARGGKSGGGSSGKGGRGDRGRGRGRDGNDGDDGDDGEGERCSGVMVLDSTSKPLWKLCCNVCPLVIRLNGDLHDVKTLPGECCGECGATKLQVVFHRDKSPLPEGDDRYTGCLLCDDLLNSLSELKEGRLRHHALRRRGGGRGGRGRRGRGKLTKEQILMSFDEF